jgi:hypothetical protein
MATREGFVELGESMELWAGGVATRVVVEGGVARAYD